MGLVVTSLVIGLVLTMLTSFYAHTTTGQYCSPDPAINANSDCSLRVINKGLPLAYEVTPNYQPKYGLQPVELIVDVAIWSGVSGAIILVTRKIKA
jgi:hypothetical protein